MKTGLQMFLAANSGRALNLTNNSLVSVKNNSLKTSSSTAERVQSVQDESVLSFSQEAIKMLEEKRENEKKETFQKMIDDLRARTSLLKQSQKTSNKDYQAEKISDTKARLKELMNRMRSALLFGDKHAAALIAKEAARLAKELAGAIKNSDTGDIGEKISVPNLNLSDESAQSAESIEQLESVENVDAESINSVETNDEPPQDAVQTEDAQQSKEAQQSDTDENKEQQVETAKKVANEAMSKIQDVVSNVESDKLNLAQKKELAEITAMLKSIIFMAKAALKQKTNNVGIGSTSKNPLNESSLQKEIKKAEDEINDAISSIEKSD